MNNRFHGKSVLVTGAASGIGRSTALLVASEGGRVAAADRDVAGLATLAAEIPGLRTFVYDAGDGDASSDMVGRVMDALGALDCLVCNAGIYRRSHFADLKPTDWDHLFSVNLTSVWRIVHTALPALKRSKGSVVALSSTAAEHGLAYAAHYAASKAAIIALIKSLAIEYASAGIRFNVVAPGRVKTGIGAGLAPLPNQDDALATRPVKLLGCLDGGAPEDISALIAFLLSGEARYITGSLVVADGAQNLG